MAVVVQNFLDKNGLATVAECVKKLIASSGSGGGASSGGALRLNAKFILDSTETEHQLTKENGLIFLSNPAGALSQATVLILPTVDESDKGLSFILYTGLVQGQKVVLKGASGYKIFTESNEFDQYETPEFNTDMVVYMGEKKWALVPLYSS